MDLNPRFRFRTKTHFNKRAWFCWSLKQINPWFLTRGGLRTKSSIPLFKIYSRLRITFYEETKNIHLFCFVLFFLHWSVLFEKSLSFCIFATFDLFWFLLLCLFFSWLGWVNTTTSTQPGQLGWVNLAEIIKKYKIKKNQFFFHLFCLVLFFKDMFEKIHFNFQAYFISRNLQIKGKKMFFWVLCMARSLINIYKKSYYLVFSYKI